MHKRVDDLFVSIWNMVPFEGPKLAALIVSRFEWFTHRVVNLFEYDQRWA